ncbi:MAG: aspartate aminotransferase family protein [Pseudomonadota bacterium]
MSSANLMTTYNRLDVTFVRGEGAELWDEGGKRYLDALSGIAVTGLGHAHTAITEALCLQAGTLVHTSNLYRITHQETLGTKLAALSGLTHTFFCNSGAEANEAALKLARRFGNERGLNGPKVLVAEGSFHGRTMATLSATGNPKVHAGFEPLLSGFVHVPFGDISAAEQTLAQDETVVAVFVEPIQGEGGVVLPPPGYLADLRELCDRFGRLLMIDEIQTGMCRTGQWFAHQHENIVPDVMTLAKGLGNGVPIGACLARGDAAEVLQPGTHGSTFGGNPLATRAALAVLETMEQESIAERAASMGDHCLAAFRDRLGALELVGDIRGQGMMIGIELTESCSELVGKALDSGLLINVTADKVIRLLPPMIMSDDELGEMVNTVCKLIEEKEHA